MDKQDRAKRVIARGEHSNHSHVICGDDVLIVEDKGTVIVTVGNSGAVLRHLLESEYVNEGREVWTEEHHDIAIEPGTYTYVPQMEYNPYNDAVQAVQD